MIKKITKSVNNLLKDYGVFDGKFKKALLLSCSQKYGELISSENDENTAYSQTLTYAENEIKANVKPRGKYSFSLRITALALSVSLLEIFSGLLNDGTAYMMITLLAITALICAAAIIKRREDIFHLSDLKTVKILAAFWILSAIQIAPFFIPKLYPYGSDCFFPCFLRLKFKHADESTFYIFTVYFNFLVSLITLIRLLVLQKRDKSNYSNGINGYVTDLLKRYGVYEKSFAENIAKERQEIYLDLLKDGKSHESAMQEALNGLDGMAKERLKPKDKYAFSLILSLFALALSLIEMIIPIFYVNASGYLGETSFAVISFFSVLVYSLINARKFRAFDLILPFVFLISWIFTYSQLFSYMFHWNPYIVYNASYIFPCVIKILRYVKSHPSPFENDAVYTNSIYIPCFNFLISLIITITLLILRYKENKK